MSSSRLIRASEIGQWAYCQRAWWLARQGHPNRNTAYLEAGAIAHAAHGRRVAASHRSRILALALLALGAVLLLA
ncbi:MAG: hypothetical protein KIS63_16820, partial [Caldilineales bacterium]|nr:hypothetical protein [Caldilineales bacterium]